MIKYIVYFNLYIHDEEYEEEIYKEFELLNDAQYEKREAIHKIQK